MGFYDKNPNTYTQNNFIEIPEGNHRVKICNVKVERFRFEKKCFEITLKVSGHHAKLWYYIWYNPDNKPRTNLDFYMFFESFQIEDFDIKHYKDWIGKSGAVCVKHVVDRLTYNNYTATVVCCLIGENRDKLPPWRNAPKDRCYYLPDTQIF